MRYFISIVTILGFRDVMIFPSRRNTFILKMTLSSKPRVRKLKSMEN